MILELAGFTQIVEKFGISPLEEKLVKEALNQAEDEEDFVRIIKQSPHGDTISNLRVSLEELYRDLIDGYELAGKYAKDKLTRKEVDKLHSQLYPLVTKHAKHATLAGSYRRGKPVVGDVDYVVTNGNLEDILAEIQTNFKTLEVSRQGQSVMTVVIQLGKKEAQVEFLNVKGDEYGSALLHSTGSGEFNQGLRGFAKGKGLILNQHGLFVVATKKRLASLFEKDVFEELGLNFIPPERRDEPFGVLKKEYMVDPKKNDYTKGVKEKGEKTWKVKSKSDPTKSYIVTLNNGVWSCQCPAFMYNKDRPKTCKHIKFVQKKTGLK